jgi:hypothetical protein
VVSVNAFGFMAFTSPGKISPLKVPWHWLQSTGPLLKKVSPAVTSTVEQSSVATELEDAIEELEAIVDELLAALDELIFSEDELLAIELLKVVVELGEVSALDEATAEFVVEDVSDDVVELDDCSPGLATQAPSPKASKLAMAVVLTRGNRLCCIDFPIIKSQSAANLWGTSLGGV